jgi:hypothetical protein
MDEITIDLYYSDFLQDKDYSYINSNLYKTNIKGIYCTFKLNTVKVSDLPNIITLNYHKNKATFHNECIPLELNLLILSKLELNLLILFKLDVIDHDQKYYFIQFIQDIFNIKELINDNTYLDFIRLNYNWLWKISAGYMNIKKCTYYRYYSMYQYIRYNNGILYKYNYGEGKPILSIN